MIQRLTDLGHDVVLGLGPDLDDVAVALFIGDQATAIVALDARNLGVGLVENPSLALRLADVADGDGSPERVANWKPSRLISSNAAAVTRCRSSDQWLMIDFSAALSR